MQGYHPGSFGAAVEAEVHLDAQRPEGDLEQEAIVEERASRGRGSLPLALECFGKR